MTRERKVQALTVGILAAAFGIVLAQKSGRQPGPVPEPPQDAIYGMLDAARTGDVKAYLGSYTGQMQSSLQQSISESSEANFARYLRQSNAAIKGIAITEPQQLTEREVKVRVEYVFQDRNEAQFMYLEKGAGSWKISRVDGVERVKTLVPYGTAVE